MPHLKFIDTPDSLKEVCRVLERSSWASVDTEADSLHHYVEKLSLVQITVGDEDYVIDPLVPLDLTELLGILAQKSLILQAADSDIRLFKKFYDFKPREVFDTMIAAQVLGYDRMGYADLVEKHCGIKLSKTEQKADWSRRPLEEKLIVYAANDTRYLKPVRDAMESELKTLGRLEWHRQQCQKLLLTLEQLKTQDTDDSRDWQIKGSKELKGQALTILRELWLWRESLAKEKDKPPFKILNAEYLVKIAQWAVAHPNEDIAQWKEAPRNIKGEHREVINRLLKGAVSLPQAEYRYPERTKFKIKWTDADTEALTKLKSAREKMALDLKIHPSLLATNAALEALVLAKPKDKGSLATLNLLLPWQIESAGGEFLNALVAI